MFHKAVFVRTGHLEHLEPLLSEMCRKQPGTTRNMAVSSKLECELGAQKQQVASAGICSSMIE